MTRYLASVIIFIVYLNTILRRFPISRHKQHRGRPQVDRTRINHRIRVNEVRVIAADGEQLGVIPTREALSIAEEQELDLVEVAPNANPPVCRLMDYGKYLYEKQKRERESRKSQKQIEIKEVRLRPKTDEHDIQVVIRKIRKFVGAEAKVRVRIRFRGREIAHPEVARTIMNRVATDVSDVADVEMPPSFEGRSMIMVLGPGTGQPAEGSAN